MRLRLWLLAAISTVSVACDDHVQSDTDDTDTSGGGSTGAATDPDDSTTGPVSTTGATGGGSKGSNGSTSSSEEESSGGADPSTTTGPDPITCQPGTLPPGRYPGVTLEHGGRTRSYDLYVPETVDVTQPSPLVINFHGLLGNPAQQAMFSQYDAAAVEAGVIVAYPAGVSNSWNTGLCCGGAQSEGVDDVGFARTLVQHIGLGSCVDPSKVFAIGMSNGGHMAHRLACEAADVFAGVASVTGVLTMLDCNPSRPISVLQFHGTADAIVRYDGAGPGYPPVEDMMDDWAARNGCAPVPNVSHQQGDALCETFPGCDGDVEVTLCTVDGGGHCWFGNPSCTFGASTTDVSANDVIGQMMAAQSLD